MDRYEFHKEVYKGNCVWETEPLEEQDSINSSELIYNEKGNLAELPFTVSGDYVGGTVGRANFDYILENYSESKGKTWWPVYGSYAHQAIVVLLDENGEIADPDFQELYDNLEQYPVLDEERLSNIEQEIADEMWNDTYRDEVREAIKAIQPAVKLLVNVGIETGVDSLAWIDPDDDAELDHFRYTREANGNVEWVCESAYTAFVRIDQFVPTCEQLWRLVKDQVVNFWNGAHAKVDNSMARWAQQKNFG